MFYLFLFFKNMTLLFFKVLNEIKLKLILKNNMKINFILALNILLLELFLSLINIFIMLSLNFQRFFIF